MIQTLALNLNTCPNPNWQFGNPDCTQWLTLGQNGVRKLFWACQSVLLVDWLIY